MFPPPRLRGGRPLPCRWGTWGRGSRRHRPLTQQTPAVPHQVVAAASPVPGDRHRSVPQQLQVGGWPSRRPSPPASSTSELLWPFVRREGRAPQAPIPAGLPSCPRSEAGVAAPTMWESVKSCGRLPCRWPWVSCPQRGCASACRFCVRTVEPGPGPAPGRRAPPPCAASPAAADEAPVPGPGAGRPLPTSEWPGPWAPRGASGLGPPMPLLVQRPRAACPGPVLLPWDHCSGLGLQRVTMTGHCRGAACRVVARGVGWHRPQARLRATPLHAQGSP